MAKAKSAIDTYAESVVSGEVIACKKVIQACRRHLNDLERGEFLFDEAEANKVFLFAENMRHIKGKWDNPYIQLQPWQKFVLGSIFGWKRRDSGLRRFRTAYIQIARKNGKSTLGSIIGLYCLVADGEPGAEVYSAATTRDQARIIFEDAKSMVRKQPALSKRLGIQTLNIHDLKTASKFQPLSADANTMDGLNVHCALVDELHAHKDPRVWDVLDTATGSRRQPLMVAITTAGFERAVCVEKYDYCEQVLSGVVSDDTIFTFITETDPEDDWKDPVAWGKANPNLGISCFPEQLEALCKRAQHIPSEQNNFLCKHLNKWVNQSERWIDLDDWKACSGSVDELELEGRQCFGGLDLSATTDLTAFVLLFPPQEKGEQWKAVYRFWVPQERVWKRAEGKLVDRVPYDAWERDGLILTTPGNVIDYEFVRSEILSLADRFDIKQIAYDPYNARETAIKLQDAGLEMVEFRQGARSYHEPMKRFYGMLLEREFCHGDHPAMSWMANNMVVRYDANMNMAPDKKSAKDRIDGIVSLLMSLGLAIVQPEEDDFNRIIEERGGFA